MINYKMIRVWRKDKREAMNEPVLIIMAAGMGSRFGGLKQIEPVGSGGEILLDFSLYDAMMAGFKKAIFVIKRENEEDFRNLIDARAGKYMEVRYAYQELDDIPKGFAVPEGRVKPWGTGHAVLAARKLTDGPAAVINADDYYGSGAFQSIYDFLEKAEDDEKYHYCMVGYKLENTLTENGYVSRGICRLSENSMLTGITERTKIQRQNGKIVYIEQKDGSIHELAEGTTVSMNFWGFTPSIMAEAEQRFQAFLERAEREDPLRSEYFLPSVVDQLIQEEKADVKVLRSMDRWYGVTYKEDKEEVAAALQSMKDKGEYPDKLWR